MKNFYFLIFLLFVGNSYVGQAQNAKQRKADRLYNELAYVEAVEAYKDLIDREHNTSYNKQRIADSYLKLRKPEQAVLYYADVVKEDNISPEYYYKYAQALRGVKQYEESKRWLQKYRDSGGNSAFVNSLLEKEISDYKLADEYTLELVDFNSSYSDFGGFEKDGVVYFVSARDEGMSKKNKVYSWNGEPFLDVYTVSESTVTPVAGDVNTILHDGPVSVSSDGKHMYFNRNNYINNREGKKDKTAINHLKIYRATNINGSWKNIVELPFNNNSYSVGHPTLSPDGKTLYFVSDMPGGQGGTDLYKVAVTTDNSYGTPENLGNRINTPLDESFPFLNGDNILYFSSNGHHGLGMMDIFKVDLNAADAKVENLGPPVNTHLDDFSYFQRAESKTGYLSSNRGGTSDDIYSFNLLNPLVLKGKVTDAVNKKPVANANVRLLDENKKQIAFLETDSDGNFDITISRNKQFPIETKHIEYQEKSGTVNSSNTDDKEELVYNIELDPIEDVEYLAEIDIIYFDFDKHNIRPDAAKELDKLVDLMINKYPELVIEIGSHTDLRGSDQYNQQLAERRAKSTYNYLISKGVKADRIVEYKGYGETEPAVKCSSCKESEHQLNRRSIFKVVKMK